MKAKKLRQKIRKENVNILRNYINEVKGMKFKYRTHIAWSIVKGKRWQAEILRFSFVVILGLAIIGVYSLFGGSAIELYLAMVGK